MIDYDFFFLSCKQMKKLIAYSTDISILFMTSQDDLHTVQQTTPSL